MLFGLARFARQAPQTSFAILLVLCVTFVFLLPKGWRVFGQSGVVTVSAASFGPDLTPDGIASAFGAKLATQFLSATTLPLPTSLGGTTVRVNGQLASLFFVSPNQVNYLIPSTTPPGNQPVVVTAGDGTVTTGTVQISDAAPAIFTVNSNGSGFPAAVLLRVKPSGAQIFDVASKSIDFGPADDRLFLILYLCGVRRSPNSTLVVIGGTIVTPGFVGASAEFVGLDQINVELPRSLSGRGRVSLVVTVNNSISSNATILDFGGVAPTPTPTPTPTPPPTPTPTPMAAPQINSINPGTALAGQEMTIQGSGFSTSLTDNQVVLVDGQGNEVAAQMTSATGTQIKALVPFGAATGVVRVRTSQGEAVSNTSVNLRTSVSGFIEEVSTQSNGQIARLPIPNITVRIQPPTGAAITQKTGADGSFVLADAPPGLNFIVIDTSTAALSYPARTIKLNVLANRDNQFPTSIEMQSVTATGQNSLAVPNGAQGGNGAIITINQGGGLATTFGFPVGCRVTQPPSETTGRIAVSVFNSGRAPAAMPIGYFSTGIAQLSPFGAQMSPRGTLRLPNPDNIPSSAVVKLFRYDQPTQGAPNSSQLGVFNEVGTAQVGNSGQIEVFENNAGNGITQTTFYFASPLYPLASVSGRVVSSDGRPVTHALVQTRGQSVFTGNDGTFTLENIPVIKTGDSVLLDINYQRPDRIVDRAQRGPVSISANGNVTLNADIVLTGRTTATQPLVLAPTRLTVNENQLLDFSFVAASQPAPNQTIAVATSGASFASVLAAGNEVYKLRLSPAINTEGEYLLNITATNGAGLKFIHTISVRVRKPPGNAPTANDQSFVTQQNTAVSFTLTGADPLSRLLQFIFLTGATANGSIGGSNPNIIYTPAGAFTRVDALQYRAVVTNTAIQSEPSLIYVIVR